MPPNDTEGSNGLIQFVRRNQFAVFVILADALSWWAWIWYRLDSGNVDAPILPIGPPNPPSCSNMWAAKAA
jgi:hypothetical protein